MDKIKILLDTDIGTDIDDAVCLAYLLAQPRCELLGITTVTGEAQKRAQMASVLCRAAGRAVPICAGAETPLLIEQRQTQAAQAVAVDRWPHDANFPPGQAVPFLRETIRQHPGEIVLLTIGPLSNIGLLFAEDPEIPRLLKALVTMGGWFNNKTAGLGPLEWNAIGDPHATAIVYRHAVARHRSIGIEITGLVSLPAEEIRRRFTVPLLRPVLDFAEVWFRGMNRLYFHDPLAAATIFNDDICAFERGAAEVELISPKLMGMTHWKADAAGRHEAAVAVNCDAFFAEYFSVF